MTKPALAVHGIGLVDPTQPVLRADDLGVQRGDGVFETARVAGGRVFKLDAHLARLAASAARMRIAAPDAGAWRELATAAVAASGAGDALLKLVCTRGLGNDGPATAFALALPVPAETIRQRDQGVAVVTLALGITAAAREQAPWLLGGVKTTSYAVNMASLREAEDRGAHDAIWLAAGGEVLEAPTATVCWVNGDRITTPGTTTGILAGTTLAIVAALAARHGYRLEPGGGTRDDLLAASEVFLASSIRGVCGVVAVDGQAIGTGAIGPVTRALRDAFEHAVVTGDVPN